MGIISPQKPTGVAKVLLTLLVIGLSPILIVAVLLNLFWGMILYIVIWLTHPKQLVIFVYSNSPKWQDYMEREILPSIQDRAVILNWSERRHWRNSLAVLAFRYFAGQRNFNPIGIIFRPFHFVKRYRFFEAFKRGNVKRLEQLKRELLEDVEEHK